MPQKIVSESARKLGERIREARDRAGYKTIVELCEAIQKRGNKVSCQYVGQIEHGKTRASFRTLKVILDACGVAASDFLAGTDIKIKEDSTVLAARLREVRERAGYQTLGQLWKAIQDRGGNITRQYLYHLEHGKNAASLNKLTMILDACRVTMDEFLGTDLIIGPRGDTNIAERKLVTMLTTIRKLNPSLARVLESAVITGHAEALKSAKERDENNRASGSRKPGAKR